MRTNWAGNVTFNAARFHQPPTVAELQDVIATADKVRALGTGHSFNPVADTYGDQVSVASLPRAIDIDSAQQRLSVSGGVRFGDVAPVLNDGGWALHNLGSLPHISIAGACSTGTHGSGVGNGNLSSAVAALDLIGPDGSLRTVRRGEADFAGSVVALGTLGVITRLELDLVPAFQVEQYVYEQLPWTALFENLAEIMVAAYSVSIFTDWASPTVNQIWVKRRADSGDSTPASWLGAHLAAGPRHPVPGVDPQHCTQQLGIAGPWHERLPHFKLAFTPSSGEELQTEYLVPAAVAPAALRELAVIKEQIASVLQISEIRAIAADELWLSPSYQQDSIALHFTWIADMAAVLPVVLEVQQRLKPFGARPHWGKVFQSSHDEISALYPRYDDFQQLRQRIDPAGKFSNEEIDRYFP